jgi:uncharacterized repeat protein (TIGR02543 family)
MKKKINTILFLLVGIMSICYLNSYSVHAHSGRLKGASYKTCPNDGIQYGYHNCNAEACTEKGHWHQVGIEDNGPELKDPCPNIEPNYDSNGNLVKKQTSRSNTTTTTVAPAPKPATTTTTRKTTTATKSATTETPKMTQETTMPVTQPQSEKITISFDTNGGEYISSRTISVGEKIKLPVPTREGYEFEGWYNKSGLTKITENYDFDDSITIYAKWKEEVKKYDEQTEKTSTSSSFKTSTWMTISIFIILIAGCVGICVYAIRK